MTRTFLQAFDRMVVVFAIMPFLPWLVLMS